MRVVFDVLYEAGRPLTVDEIADRAYERVHPAVLYQAKRAYERDRARERTSLRKHDSERDVDERRAWRQWLAQLLRNGVRRQIVLREGSPYDSGQRYSPNPAKAPRVERTDGTVGLYTRDMWLEIIAHERAAGEIQAMSMEASRVLGPMDRDTLRQAVALAARTLVDNPIDERSLRGKLRWLIERPSTDEGRAWLLTELVRRAYGAETS
jgi:hypothetical protein